jgi:hypothetical protein
VGLLVEEVVVGEAVGAVEGQRCPPARAAAGALRERYPEPEGEGRRRRVRMARCDSQPENNGRGGGGQMGRSRRMRRSELIKVMTTPHRSLTA